MSKKKSINEDDHEIYHIHTDFLYTMVAELEAYHKALVDHSEGEVTNYIQDMADTVRGKAEFYRSWIRKFE